LPAAAEARAVGDLSVSVPASEFTRKLDRHRIRTHRGPITGSTHDQITGHFIGLEEYQEFKRFRKSHRSFRIAALPEKKVEAIRASRLDPRHAPFDKLNAQ
jgi:hypothetical protein